jgi:hypothetical protein
MPNIKISPDYRSVWIRLGPAFDELGGEVPRNRGIAQWTAINMKKRFH